MRRFDIVRTLWRTQGALGFYRGLSAGLLGVTPEKAIKLTVNDLARHHLAGLCSVPAGDALPVHLGMLAGGIAGGCQVLATNPMEMVKINMQLSPARSRSVLSIVHSIGLRGLYKGTAATLMRDIPFSVIFFQSFASACDLLRQQQGREQLGQGPVLAAGLAAGAVGAVAVTPMDVVKTRYQSGWYAAQLAGSAHKSLSTIWWGTWRAEGLPAFFKGSLQRCLIVGPLFGISLMTYEFLQQHLS